MKERKQVTKAKEAVLYFKENHPEDLGHEVSKEVVIIAGEPYAQMYQGVPNDEAAEDKLNTYLNFLRLVDPNSYIYIVEMMRIPDNIMLAIGGARWVHEELPLFRFNVAEIEELITTPLNREIVKSIVPPSPAFFIELPKNHIYLKDMRGEMAPATGIFVYTWVTLEPHQLEEKVKPPGRTWSVMIMADIPTTQWRKDQTIEEITDIDSMTEDGWMGLTAPLDQYDRLLNHAVGRIICGVCLDWQRHNVFEEPRSEEVCFTDELQSLRQTRQKHQFRVYERRRDGTNVAVSTDAASSVPVQPR